MYNETMTRRAFIAFIALSLVLVGYQPSLGMTVVTPASMEMSASADGDCAQTMPDDCCDKTEKDKRLCVWDDACAARCHVNAGLEIIAFVDKPKALRYGIVPTIEAPPLHPARAGPHFRPPIV